MAPSVPVRVTVLVGEAPAWVVAGAVVVGAVVADEPPGVAAPVVEGAGGAGLGVTAVIVPSVTALIGVPVGTGRSVGPAGAAPGVVEPSWAATGLTGAVVVALAALPVPVRPAVVDDEARVVAGVAVVEVVAGTVVGGVVVGGVVGVVVEAAPEPDEPAPDESAAGAVVEPTSVVGVGVGTGAMVAPTGVPGVAASTPSHEELALRSDSGTGRA
jgi:hypothetical protein